MEIIPYPARSPIIISDVLQPLIQDKVVCDVGCSAGDLMLAFKHYAKNVIGIEWELDRFPEKAAKDLNIIKADALATNFIMPQADVYYIWVNSLEVGALIDKIDSGIIVLGDYGDKPDIKEDFGGITIKVPFKDSEYKGWWRLTIIQK